MNIVAPLTKEEVEKLISGIEDADPRLWGKQLSLTVKIICKHPDTPQIVMVKSKKKEICPGVTKESKWELPGGGVLLKKSPDDGVINETPHSAAEREFSQETGMPRSIFEIGEILGASKKISIVNPLITPYHYDIVFVAIIKEMAHLPPPGRVKSDPTEGTLKWDWINPIDKIKMASGSYYYEAPNQNEPVSRNSMVMINRFILSED